MSQEGNILDEMAEEKNCSDLVSYVIRQLLTFLDLLLTLILHFLFDFILSLGVDVHT